LSVEQLGTMLWAFEQGAAILWLIGQMSIDADTLRQVMLRVLRPGGE
jgi:hypothetical protein